MYYYKWEDYKYIKELADLPKPQKKISVNAHRREGVDVHKLDFRLCTDAQFDIPNWVINMVHLATVRNVQVRLEERASHHMESEPYECLVELAGRKPQALPTVKEGGT